jgi:hypothetical protein
MLALWKLSMISPEKWELMRVGDIADRDVPRISPEYLVTEAMRLLGRREGEQLLLGHWR